MKRYIGADLGTSALKLLLVDETGAIEKKVTRSYGVFYPAPGWSEQSPEDWWEALRLGLRELLVQTDPETLCGIGVGGQMHGLVVLDDGDRVIRPAILWNDGRTARQTEDLNRDVSRLADATANMAFAGFTAPKILWMKEREPENFAKISKLMLPKDYLNYRLTGRACTDFSDASGLLLLDVAQKKWSSVMLEICGIREEQLPKLCESCDVVGTVLPSVAAELGIPELPVVAGAGDNAAAAVGTGTLKAGTCNISLGTSGTVFIPYDTFSPVENHSIHNFCHANGKYHLMGCMLSAASCNKWFCEDILGTGDYAAEQAGISDGDLGRNHVYFLPYLMGERSPINDTEARGVFFGMRADTKRQDLVLSVLEGVSFAIRQNLEIAKETGVEISRSTVCGGGARSELWCRILSNVLNLPLDLPKTEEGPGYGGAMLAMVGTGRYESTEACAEALLSVRGTVEPDPEIAARYEEKYRSFCKLYPAMKNLYQEL